MLEIININWNNFRDIKGRLATFKSRALPLDKFADKCSDCGHIADENRKSQSEFECVSCGFKTNADFNAARNIALPDIEKRIKSEIERMAFVACES